MSCALAVHGGAGRADQEDPAARHAVLRAAMEAGATVLAAGGAALDAVERAVALLEDDARFNAGTGSVLTWDGRVEMDASIMEDGDRFGAVAAITGVRNPVRVARRVLEETPHWLLAGPGAVAFARQRGFDDWKTLTPERRAQWRKLRRAILAAARRDPGRGAKGPPGYENLVELVRAHPEVRGTPGTVGAVALDRHGRAAAATSTGGVWLKLRGRVGDSAFPGAGTFVGPGGAVSATGQGEEILRTQVARQTEALLRDLDASSAAARAIEAATAAGCECGVITVDRRGGVGAAFNTAAMPVEVWVG
ncbi:MAG: isoaspartyl peptidase/L-asparaginase [Deltaproteobacteria bacterium]|nr:isoaspartyl peptidase/L-asparaginase [Deltaproteobacteria bacterium]